jgi:hypothetical protein
MSAGVWLLPAARSWLVNGMMGPDRRRAIALSCLVGFREAILEGACLAAFPFLRLLDWDVVRSLDFRRRCFPIRPRSLRVGMTTKCI